MKIAAAAYPLDWHNRWNEYVGKLRVWVRTAAENGAQLLVFPEKGALELASLAREDNAKDAKRAVDAITARIKDVDELHSSLAREFNVHILAATAPLRIDDGDMVNRARLFSSDGSVGFQDQRVPSITDGAAGKAARVFETELGKIGILPGQDGSRAGLASAMAAAGAEILLLPTCTPDVRAFWRSRIAAKARAMENRCFVVHAVTVGDADWLAMAPRNVGAAAVFGPPEDGLPEDGNLAAGKMNAAGWVYAEADIQALRAIRAATTSGDVPDPGAVETVALGSAEAEENKG